MAEPTSTPNLTEKKPDEERKAKRRERSNEYRRTEAGRAARRREKRLRNKRHPEKVREEWRQHRIRHREKRIAYMREYNRLHGERLRGMCLARYYAKHDECLAKKREWDSANPGYDRLWRKQNPEARRAIDVKKTAKRRAVKKNAAVGTDRRATLARIRELKDPEVLPCFWCNMPVPKATRHIDHIIPLSRGGPHSAENLVASCAHCNCSKRAKMPHEFRP